MKNTEKKGIMKPTDNIGCAVQWNFPEMRHLELQFLPIEHRYVNPAPADLNNRALWRTCRPSLIKPLSGKP